MALFKSKIKYLRNLQRKKYRQKYNNFMVEGDKMAREILVNGQLEVEGLYALESWPAGHHSLLSSLPKNRIHVVTSAELKQISGLKTPNQVVMVVQKPEQTIDPKVAKDEMILYLDDIRDPGNMGTILRIADWFAVPYVVVSQGCADVFSPKVIQASMGAFQRVRCPEMPLSELVRMVPDATIWGASMEGQNLFKMERSAGEPAVIVIGNEGQGISTANQGLIKNRISIPRAEGGGAESLNAAVAAGIICAFWRNG